MSVGWAPPHSLAGRSVGPTELLSLSLSSSSGTGTPQRRGNGKVSPRMIIQWKNGQRCVAMGGWQLHATVASSASSWTAEENAAASEKEEDPVEVQTTTTMKKSNSEDAFVPYQGPQFKEALSEIFIPQSLPKFPDDEHLWVPQTDTVSFRPLCFCVSSGYYVNLLRVRGAGLLSRHRHPGPVHGHVLKGSWKYLEHDWIATEGSYVFEPPGEIHTLVVPEGVDEMITLFHVTGSLLYCDPQGTITGAEDVFTKLEKAKAHYESIGLGADFVQQFVR
jgi:2,4'-dihydroxyacetophenone dioxygenase